MKKQEEKKIVKQETKSFKLMFESKSYWSLRELAKSDLTNDKLSFLSHYRPRAF